MHFNINGLECCTLTLYNSKSRLGWREKDRQTKTIRYVLVNYNLVIMHHYNWRIVHPKMKTRLISSMEH